MRHVLRLVRMNADGRVNPIVRLGIGHRRIQLFRPRSSPNRQQRRYSRCPRALQHRLAILRELFRINMRMRIDQFHGRDEGAWL